MKRARGLIWKYDRGTQWKKDKGHNVRKTKWHRHGWKIITLKQKNDFFINLNMTWKEQRELKREKKWTELKKWQNDKMTKWQNDKMTKWQNDKMTKWQNDKMTERKNGQN